MLPKTFSFCRLQSVARFSLRKKTWEMHRLFQGAPPPPLTINVQVGDPFLDGVYKCAHCQEPMAQLHRFTLESKSFCSPECLVAAFPLMKEQAEQQFGRRIVGAPPRNWKGMKRRDWLPECRRGFTELEMSIVQKEMVVQNLQPRKRLQK